MTRAAGRATVLAAVVLFSTGGAAIKACSLDGSQIASLRALVAGLFLFVILPEVRTRWTWRSWLVGSAYAATLTLYVLAMKTTTAANAIFLQSTAPLYLLVLAPWLLGERIRRRSIGLMVVLAAGLVLLLAGGEPPRATASDPLLGNLLGALCGATWALTLLGLRWLGVTGGEGRDTGASAVVAGSLLACVVCLPWTFPLGAVRAVDGLLILYLGVVQVGLAYVLLTRGMRVVPAFQASLLILLDPVLNPIWAFALHGERPARLALIGGALILVATAADAWLSAQERRA
ncbi:MAG: DMT family transporter [Acidobacteriota bacterium]|nr:DMT family transporter [Acidobacteriota bacterium]